jgi:hypothetical protein
MPIPILAGLTGVMGSKGAIAMFSAGVALSVGGHAVKAASPYIGQFANDMVSPLGAETVYTNRNGWVGTKGATAPLGATGDLALAAHRLRNRS